MYVGVGKWSILNSSMVCFGCLIEQTNGIVEGEVCRELDLQGIA